MPFRRSRTELRRGDKIVAVQAVGRVPEGTRGTIQVIDGFKWTRYWVMWETGEWTGSVDAGAVVAAKGYEAFKAERAAAATRAPVPAAITATKATDAPAASGGGSGVPEHLLERARLARERKAAAAG